MIIFAVIFVNTIAFTLLQVLCGHTGHYASDMSVDGLNRVYSMFGYSMISIFLMIRVIGVLFIVNGHMR